MSTLRFDRLLLTGISKLCMAVLLAGCSPALPGRDGIIGGAEAIAAGPDFQQGTGSSGSSKGDHHFYQGSFLVTAEDLGEGTAGANDAETLCWDVFQAYGAYVREHVDLDAIPDMIARGGSNQYDPRATRYDYAFVAAEVSVIYDVEWFRGGPKKPDHENPTVQVRYHIRIN